MSDHIERFSASDPCPICGGYANLPRGNASRCHGFWGSDRKYAHCSREEHAGALAIDTKSLTYSHKMLGQCHCGTIHVPDDHEYRPPPRARVVATYDYVDELGQLLFQAVRYDPKNFAQRQPDGRGGWYLHLKGVRRVLYRLPELIDAKPGSMVYIVEGEKDVDRLQKAGLIATCNPMGSGKWRDEFSPFLKGQNVIVIADNDKAGRDHARAVASSVLPHVASLKILDLAQWGEQLGLAPFPEKGDVSEFLDMGGTVDDLEWIDGRTEPLKKSELPPPEYGQAQMIRLSDVVRRPVDWLWDQRYAIGGLNLLFGDPGDGKSFLTLAMSAAVSRGAPWPDRPGEVRDPASVIILSAEDSLATTIGPRLDAAGADSTRIHALTTVRMADGKLSPFNIRRDVPVLDDALAKVGDCKLLVIDPVSSYLGGADEHKNAEVREVIGPLTDLAERHGCAIVLVTHLNKGSGPKAVYRSTGSLAFVAAARMAWMLCRDKDDRSRRLMLPAKANIAADPTGMAYRIVDGVLQWETDPIRMWADDALGDGKRNAGADVGVVPTAKERDAMVWLTNHLGLGQQRHGATFKAAEEAGFSKGVFYRALDHLKAERFETDGVKYLRLPDGMLFGNEVNEGTQ